MPFIINSLPIGCSFSGGFTPFHEHTKFRRKRDLSTNRLATAMPFTGVSLLIHSRVHSFICSIAQTHARIPSLTRSFAHPYHLKWDAHNPIRLGLIKIHQNGIYLFCFFFVQCILMLCMLLYLRLNPTHGYTYACGRLNDLYRLRLRLRFKFRFGHPRPHTHTHHSISTNSGRHLDELLLLLLLLVGKKMVC